MSKIGLVLKKIAKNFVKTERISNAVGMISPETGHNAEFLLPKTEKQIVIEEIPYISDRMENEKWDSESIKSEPDIGSITSNFLMDCPQKLIARSTKTRNAFIGLDRL